MTPYRVAAPRSAPTPQRHHGRRMRRQRGSDCFAWAVVGLIALVVLAEAAGC